MNLLSSLILVLFLLASPAYATSTNPGGSPGQVQFNNTGYFGGISLGLPPEVYGAACDGTTDDSTAMQQWATQMVSGTHLILPDATCIVKSGITFGSANSTVVGGSITGGGTSSVIKYTGTSTTANILTIGSPSTAYEFDQVYVANFRVTSTTQMTSGAGVLLYKFGRGTVSNVYADGQDGTGNLWNGFVCAGCNDMTFYGGGASAQNDDLQAYSILPIANTPASGCYCGPVFIVGGKYAPSNTGPATAPVSGIHLASLASVTLDAADVVGNTNNILIDTAQSSPCQCSLHSGNQGFLLGRTGFIDSAVTDNIHVNDSGVGIGNKEIRIDGDLATAGAYDLNVINWNNNGGVSYISVNSGEINSATSDGIRIADTLTQLSVSPTTYIDHNGGYGVNCTSSTTNVSVLSHFYSNNTSGNIATNCNNSYTLLARQVVQSGSATNTTTHTVQDAVPAGYVRAKVTNTSNTNLSNANWQASVPAGSLYVSASQGVGAPYGSIIYETGLSSGLTMVFGSTTVGTWLNGLQIGASPTGGDKGAGTINVSSNYYINGALASISGISLGANLGTLTFGTHLISGGSSYNGSTGVTITSDATNANTASTIVARDGSGNFTAGTVTAALSGNATTATSLANARSISMTGDVAWTISSFDGSGNVTAAGTLASVGTAATYGSATVIPIITTDVKGRTTTVATATATPAVGSITGLGTGIATALGVNTGSAGAPVLFNGAGGTPSSLTGTNISGTAASLTAGNVTTNANSTGDVTSVGNATTIATNAVTNAKAAQMVANTMKGNWTGSTANGADNAMPSCSDTSGNHLNYVSGTGITCGTSDAHVGTVTSITFTGDGTVLSNTPSSAVTASGTVTAALANAAAGTVLDNTSTSSAAPLYTAAPRFGTSATTPIIYGGSATGSSLTIDATSNGSPSAANVYIKAEGGGNTIIGAASVQGGGLQTTGVEIDGGTGAGSDNLPALEIRGTSTSKNGGGELKLFNTGASVSGPGKYLYVNSSGAFTMSNSAFSQTLFSITDAGIPSFPQITNTATTSALCINTGTGTVTYDGTIGTCTVSDERLKDKISELTDVREKMHQINAWYYVYKDQKMYGKGVQLGLMAQNVQKVFPELVSKDSMGKFSLDYQRLTAPLIVEVNQHDDEIESLKKQVAMLSSAVGHACFFGMLMCAGD